MDLPQADEVILLFIPTKIDKASLALPCSFKGTLSLKYTAILLVNKIEPVDRSADRSTFIFRKYTGNNNFHIK